MKLKREISRWAIVLTSDNKLDGKSAKFAFENGNPILCMTRKEARALAHIRYGYIKNRPDLRAEPHGWKPARVARVKMTMIEVTP